MHQPHLVTKPFVRALTFALAIAGTVPAAAGAPIDVVPSSPDLEVVDAGVTHHVALGLLEFHIRVRGTAGATSPVARGALDGAPVLAYVFPTTIAPAQVGFGSVEGVLALAITAHPDFDDTPLWDEDGNFVYDDDGWTFHSHWVVLGSDDRVAGGLSVIEFDPSDASVVMPPTNPGMPMYLDSPGFPVMLEGDRVSTVVPVSRVRGSTGFSFDAVTAYLQVNTSDANLPMLGVYHVYDVLSGDLSLPYEVTVR
jgi:hypothetical protein